MAFFIAIVISDFKNIFFSAFRPYCTYGCIASNSKNIKVGVFLFAFIFSKPLFGLFSGLFVHFRIFKRTIYKPRLLGFMLSFFNLKVFYDNSLDLNLG